MATTAELFRLRDLDRGAARLRELARSRAELGNERPQPAPVLAALQSEMRAPARIPSKKAFGGHDARESTCVIEIVAAAFEVAPASLVKRTNAREVVRPRQVAMYLMHRDLGMSFPAVGRRFGGLHAVRLRQPRPRSATTTWRSPTYCSEW